jgi:hypothetical protein
MHAFWLALALPGVTLQGPDVRKLIETGPDGTYRIRYAIAADVCLTETSLRIGSSAESGDGGWVIYSDGFQSGACDDRVATVTVTRAAGKVTAIRVFGSGRPGGTDLGQVSAAGAARAWLAIAAEQDGRVGREAVLAAVLADSVDLGAPLLGLARGEGHSRGLLEAAAGWLGRALARSGGAGSLAQSLGDLAGDREVPESVRTRAVSALGRAGDGAVPRLKTLATQAEPAIARAAIQALARQAGPTARTAIRALAGNLSTAAAPRAEAIRALGNRDAVPDDLALLRRLWPTLVPESARQAALDALGEAGGPENARWLVSIVSDTTRDTGDRARAVRAAERAGTQSAELTRLYRRETGRPVRLALLEALGRIADRVATETIRSVAERDTDPQLRRAAVRWLSQSGGEENRDLLRSLVER